MVGICLHVVLANQAPVVQTVDNSIHWINHYPVDSIIHPLKKLCPSWLVFTSCSLIQWIIALSVYTENQNWYMNSQLPKVIKFFFYKTHMRQPHLHSLVNLKADGSVVFNVKFVSPQVLSFYIRAFERPTWWSTVMFWRERAWSLYLCIENCR